ncbi:hypothetical protein AKJ53_01455 [candidate division MSBL1 archaeon SCGC-AAA382F02]|uniref:Pyrrolo-quinoline quinone repeat domain-containing protein n=1 Tax=candidate division MSBL1 archaeon SCGC-AAA382F02 TaxID=1698282 RepID=A0A133VHY8_9EURY|nr:hypothetical protein AKJ53_01455 [candidate division MSBL1 archaeon SCGC-AAA382F02]
MKGKIALIAIPILFFLLFLNTPTGIANQKNSTTPVSLKGEITTPPRFVDDYLMFGSSQGFYVFSNSDLITYIESSSVRDFAKIGGNKVIVVTEEEYFPNIKCYSLSTGKVQWSYSHTMEVYNTQYGKINSQVKPFDIEKAGDINSDGVTDIAVSLGHSIVGIGGSSGEVLWEVSHDTNVWRLQKLGNSLFAGTQDGYLYSINSSNGEIKFKKKLAQKFELRESGSGRKVGEVNRSVWSIEILNAFGSDHLAVSTEDGKVHLVNPEDGNVKWEAKVLEYSSNLLFNYYNEWEWRRGLRPPTIPGDSNFFNLTLKTVGDVDETGNEDIIAIINPRGEPGGRSYEGTTRAVYLLNSNTGEVKWQNKILNMTSAGNTTSGEIGGEEKLLVPSSTRGEIFVVDLDSGNLDNDIKIETVSRNINTETYYLGASNDKFTLVSNNGDLSISNFGGDLLWEFPRITNIDVKSGNFVSGESEDFLIHSGVSDTSGSYQSRSILLRNGEDGSISWTRILPRGDYLKNNGFSKIRKIDNMSGGGGADILTCRQVGWDDRSEQAPAPSLILLSGNNGEILWERSLVNKEGEHISMGEGDYLWVVSLDVISDINGNGSSDIIIGSRGRVFIEDSATGEVLWERIYQDDAPILNRWNWVEDWESVYRVVNDLNNDGTKDIVARTEDKKIAILESESTNKGLEYSIKNEIEVDGSIPRNRIEVLKDLDGDGVEEVSFRVDSEEGSSDKVVSPRSGDTLLSIEEIWKTKVSWAEADFTGNEIKETIIQSEAEGGPELSLYEGSEKIWTHRFSGHSYNVEKYGYQYLMPAASAGDVNGDQVKDLAVVKNHEWGKGLRVDIYNVNKDKLLKSIIIEEFEKKEEKKAPGILAKQISDLTGDGNPELGVVSLRGSFGQKKVSFFVVDPQSGVPLVSLNSLSTDILSLKKDVGVLNLDGSLDIVDVSQRVSVASPEEKSPLSINWDIKKECVTTVIVDGTPVALTTDNSAEVRLPPGKHEITVQSVDEDGVSSYDTIEVNLGGGSSMHIALYGITAVLFAVLFLPTIFKKVRK